ncbi:MAG: ATP-binding protein, partial [Rhodothermaceae bacterium]
SEILLGKVKLFLEINDYKYKLVKRQSLINATLEATADGVMVINSKNRIVRSNQRFIDMWGLEVQDDGPLESSYIKSFMVENVKNSDELEKYIETDKAEFKGNFNNRIIELKNGKIFKLCIKPQMVFDEITGYVFTFGDITQQKTLEKRLEENNRELAGAHAKMEEVTFNTVLLNKKLAESEKKLIELNANKDRFFSIISHDLKSPFSSLLGLTELLHREYDTIEDETRKTWISSMNNQTQNIYNLLESLLEWAKTQTGRMDFNPEKFDLYNLVDDLFDLFENNALGKEIRLTNEIHQEILLFGDVNMNMTVLRNLLSNAIKFTPRGGEVKVWCEETEAEHKISVSDSGVGMDKNALDSLFKIEVYNTTLGTEDEKGTGVGLILCEEFVKKHKGVIYAESEIDKGSVFTYTIPKEMEKV